MALHKVKITIHRTRIGKDIVAEFAIPRSAKHQKEGRVVILCQGAPTMPGKSNLMEFIASKGFFVVLPRYRGTWESSGRFLEKEPTEDIKEVIAALTMPLLSLYEGVAYSFPKKPKIFLFASSFGAPASFFLSKHPLVKKVIALSPVVDWCTPSKAEPLESFTAFTKEVYGEGYRFAPKGWMKLAKGDFYNPATALTRVDGSKIAIFHAKDDDIIDFDSVDRFALASGIKAFFFSPSGGHLGLSEVMNPETWSGIKKFLK